MELHVKHLSFGAFLVLYAMFLTPAYFEPMDLIISTGWIALAYATFGDAANIIVPIWMLSGYLALVFGLVLLGKGFHGLGVFGNLGKKIEIFIGDHPKTTAIMFFAILLLIFTGVLTTEIGIITLISLLILIGAFAYLLESKNFADRTFITLLLIGVFLFMFTNVQGFQILNPSLQNLFP